jgi:hypothetical protein
MPGGIGPISESTLSACTARDRVIAAVDNANEIFFHLDGRRVYYDSSERFLYFVATAAQTVPRTILSTAAGVQGPVVFEQLYLDANRFFDGACRVALTRRQAHAVLVALRLAGVRATIR